MATNAYEREQERAEAQAQAYLNGAASAGLRAALSIPTDAPLVPHLLGMGEHNINVWFAAPDDHRFVLRINVATQPFHTNQIRYEYGALEAACPSGCTPAPLFLDDSAQAPGKGVLVETFCAGQQLDFDDLRPGDVRCALQMMADVHAVEMPAATTLFRPADPLREMFDECAQRFASYRASGFEDARITRWTERFMAATRAMLDAVAPPQDIGHLINTETLPSHFLIPADAAARAAAAPAAGTGRFCDAPGCVVDWERPVTGEVAQDVAYFVSPTTTFWDSSFLFPVCDVAGVIHEYWRAVDGRFPRTDFESRFRAWRMMTALKSTTWCVQAIPRYSSNTGAHTTEKTAGKLPVYLSDEFMELIAKECFYL